MVEAEAEIIQGPIRVGFMPGDMIGPNVGTTKTVRIIARTDRRAVAVEAVNTLDEVEEDLVGIIFISQDVPTTNSSTMVRIKSRRDHLKTVTIMNLITFQHQIAPLVLQLYHPIVDHITRPERLRHQAMQWICISTISFEASTAVHGALGGTIMRRKMVGHIDMRRCLLIITTLII